MKNSVKLSYILDESEYSHLTHLHNGYAKLNGNIYARVNMNRGKDFYIFVSKDKGFRKNVSHNI